MTKSTTQNPSETLDSDLSVVRPIKAIPIPESYALNFMAMAQTPKFAENGDLITLQFWEDGRVTWAAQNREGEIVTDKFIRKWKNKDDGSDSSGSD